MKDEADLQQRIKTMTPSQMDAYKVMTNSSQQRLLFVTGPGGTGKSFLIHSVVAQLTLNEGRFVEMLATSGSAAYLLGGKTIHRFFRLGVKLETYLEWGTVDCSMVSNTDVLIIDECSMMSASLLERVHEMCCFATKDPSKKNLLFAGKSVYLFGDLFQLPAVDNPQLYQSHLWKHFQIFQLKENCRQSGDKMYADTLNRVRVGNHNSEDLKLLSRRVCGSGHPVGPECSLSQTATVLCSRHEQKGIINGQLLAELSTKLIECHAVDTDNSGAPLNRYQTDYLNRLKSFPPSILRIKVGARVVITRNVDVAGGVVNGTIGTVENIQPNLVTVRRLRDNELMCISHVKHSFNLPHTSDIIVREQFPLILGWAVTVHRVQGMTVDSNVFVVMDSTFFATGQAYVALSRVRKSAQLHFLAFNPSEAIKVSNHVRSLYGLQPIKETHVEHTSSTCGTKVNAAIQPAVLPSVHMIHAPPTVALNPKPSVSTSVVDSSAAIQTTISPTVHTIRAPSTVALDVSTTMEDLLYLSVQLRHNRACFEQFFTDNERRIQEILQSIFSLPSPYREGHSVSTDRHIQSLLHPALLEALTPVRTTGDGNCLWNAISITLCGSEKHAHNLRLLIAYGLIKFKNQMIAQIQRQGLSDTEAAHNRLYDLLRIAITPFQWGLDFHVYVMAIVLNTPIFVFTSFKGNTDRFLIDPSLNLSQLSALFRSHGDLTSAHQLHCSNECYFQLVNESLPSLTKGPLSIFFNVNHFVGLLFTNMTYKNRIPILYARWYVEE